MVTGALAAPFPYFGGKSLACEQVWAAFGDVKNYVEPFCGSAAMLLGAPEGKRVETINDYDGFVSNFWRAIAYDPEIVAHYADVRAWCAENGDRQNLRIVLCGHAGEHDALLDRGWRIRRWVARKGYALTDEAVRNSASETLWCSPHCVKGETEVGLFT